MNLLYVPIFIWGLLIGSFLNVIIYRLPRNLSIVFPGSFCPHCNSPIPLYRNIPVLSFIIQKGKCHNCKRPISISYPLIEITTGIIWFLFSYITFGGYEIDSIILLDFFFSRTKKPILCLVPSYFNPGLPRPTSNRKSPDFIPFSLC